MFTSRHHKKREQPGRSKVRKDSLLPSPKTTEGRMVFLRKLKEISQKHVDEIECKSNETCKTTDISMESDQQQQQQHRQQQHRQQHQQQHQQPAKPSTIPMNNKVDARVVEKYPTDDFKISYYKNDSEEEERADEEEGEAIVQQEEGKLPRSPKQQHNEAVKSTIASASNNSNNNNNNNSTEDALVSTLTNFFSSERTYENMALVSEGLVSLKEKTSNALQDGLLQNSCISLSGSCDVGCSDVFRDDVLVGKASDYVAAVVPASPNAAPARNGNHHNNEKRRGRPQVTSQYVTVVNNDDDRSVGNVSAITMQTLLREDMRRQRTEEFAATTTTTVPEEGPNDDMSFDAAVETLVNLSVEMGIPFKDLINGQGLREVAARRGYRSPQEDRR